MSKTNEDYFYDNLIYDSFDESHPIRANAIKTLSGYVSMNLLRCKNMLIGGVSHTKLYVVRLRNIALTLFRI